MNDLVFLSATQTASLIRSREVSVREVVEAYLGQIRRHNSTVNAIVTMDEEGALRRAQEADAALSHGETWGPLHGVPVTLKDVHDTAGMKTTFGNAEHVNHIPAEDSTIAARLKSAGAILLGKTNVELFPDNPFGKTRNPWDLSRTSGTSSSGASAALASGMSALDVATDATGSLTIPAHFTGTYGLRPTEHRIPFRFFLDPALWHVVLVAGPMARSVEDLRLALHILAGHDEHNPVIPPVPLRAAKTRRIQDLRVAWVSQFEDAPTAAPIREAIEQFAVQLQQLGLHVEQVTPTVDLREQSRVCSRLVSSILEALTPTPSLLKNYLLALDERNRFIWAWDRFFDQWDVFLCPPDFRTAPLLGGEDFFELGDREVTWEELIVAGLLFPVTGHPSVVIPLATDPIGLPLGLQLLGPRWQENDLLSIAELLSQVSGGFHRPPGY